MKIKYLILLIIPLLFLGCEEKENYPTINPTIFIRGLDNDEILFIDGKEVDQNVSFTVAMTAAASQNMTVNISIDPQSDMTASQYSISPSQFTIKAGEFEPDSAGTITFLYDGFTIDENRTLIITLDATGVELGDNAEIEVTATKGENPLIATFPGDYTGWYWGSSETVGDYGQGWDSPITLTFDTSDPNAETMIMNNLWWGGADIKVVFNFNNNTLSIEGGQELDCCWDNDPYFAPWTISAATGTFDIATKKLVFDYQAIDVGNQVYGTYTAWVTPN